MDSVAEPTPLSATGGTDVRSDLERRYRRVRGFTEALCEGLDTEDYVIQSRLDVSPTKWHLAHTSWFFERFLLSPHLPGYRPLEPIYAFLFNSYYIQAGERHCRAQRGYLSRPTIEEVFAYRRHVDRAVVDLLDRADDEAISAFAPVLELRLDHEQQQQELMLPDIKHVFSVNPLRPAYRPIPMLPAGDSGPVRWVEFEGAWSRSGIRVAPSPTTTRDRVTGSSWSRSTGRSATAAGEATH